MGFVFGSLGFQLRELALWQRLDRIRDDYLVVTRRRIIRHGELVVVDHYRVT